jgi:hypothetical protein
VTLSCGCEGVCGFDVRVWRAEALDVSEQLRIDLRVSLARQRRWPWAPVEDYLHRRCRPEVSPDGRLQVDTHEQFARFVGVHVLTLRQWRLAGDLSMRQAEDVADRLGLHPWDFWPDFYEPASEDRAVTAA